MLFLFLAVYTHAFTIDSDYGKVVSICDNKSKQTVWIFKQWHLQPNDMTYPKATKEYPQTENQVAIYKQVASLVEKKELQTLVAEGCESEITSEFNDKFNGWGFAELEKEKASGSYPKILSHIPLKIEAKYGDQVRVLCGDNPALVQKHNLAFSDARGIVGFLKRLIEFEKKPAKAKPYLEEAIKIFKWPKDTTTAQAILKLREKLKTTLQDIRRLAIERDQKFIETFKTIKDDEFAVIVGGAHAIDLKLSLEKQGFGCKVVEPTGYAEGPNLLLDFMGL